MPENTIDIRKEETDIHFVYSFCVAKVGTKTIKAREEAAVTELMQLKNALLFLDIIGDFLQNFGLCRQYTIQLFVP